ncbi:unnamed protein product [Diatraea saccharalis]|uniref:Uncharacterized protein n=1 Tax=Diatraea saccharalis TaxID=40085 RepID=A0A9P0C4U5_9NEOP|nr:unnamed protein product [Diatraea saccharalis]
MPPLVNVPSPIYLSHTNPPFIYKYVGDQVKILQVIGNYQFDPKVNDKMEATLTLDQTNSLRKFSQETVIQDIIKQSENEYVVKENFTHTPEPGEKRESNIKYDNLNEPIECKSEIVEETIESKVEVKEIESNTKTDIIQDIASTNLERSIEFKSSEIDKQNVEPKLEVKQIESNTKTGIQDIDSTSLEISINENLSAESDDEASFGTPEDSPKMKRRSPKGKYGKAKAPPPPKLNLPKQNIDQDSIENEFDAYTTSQESLNDIINQMPKIAENKTKGGGLQVVNPIAEKKRRHKSKSPGRIPKSHSSGLGKLLQLPNKFVFWNKSDDKPKADNYVLDSVSTSGDHSRRSSTIEKQMDDYQSCLDLDAIISSECNPSLVDDMASARSSLKDATDVDNEILSNDIIEKSDALQKIIEAKIESHPEYKYVSLHEEIPTTSKSTDV